ncbi:MAG: stage II sporulation protein R [Oscillospiraceae bacterium]|nr:stage II sporulation protein R [Oscillospiraceae bacterium]
MRKFLMVFLCAAALWAVWAQAAQAAVADKVIRLHVVANSDSEADQAYKLQVRDRVLAQVSRLTEAADSSAAAAELIEENLALIGQAAGENCAVQMEKKTFTTRDYGIFALPAGSYTALTVTVGEGAGQNWWCVVFPPLCQSATEEEFTAAAAQAGLTEGEIAFITGGERESVVFKFKTLEIISKIFG